MAESDEAGVRAEEVGVEGFVFLRIVKEDSVLEL